jgi:hypothetical protein
MKNSIMRKLLAIAGCVTLVCSVHVGLAAAATSAFVATNGEIITAVSITPGQALSFGQIAAGSADTKVTVDPSSGGRTRDITDETGAQLIGESGTGKGSYATFSVVGQGIIAYTVTLPAVAGFDLSDGNSHTMHVNAFTSNQVGLTNLSGTTALQVGATVTVTGGQAPGSYTNANGLNVTVAYN